VSQYGQIDVSIEDEVLTIEIGGLDGPTHAGLARVFRDAHDSDAKVVVVTGKNRTFLGPDKYDFDWVTAMGEYGPMLQMFKEGEQIIRDSISVEKPMIAKVYAPGAHSLGASIALACDFVYAADDATFSDPHLSGFGVPPGDGGALLWPVRIGLTRAREFLLTDRVATANEAVEIGLINKAVPANQLDAEVDALVEKLKSYDPLALRMSKKWLNQYVQQSLNTVGLGTLAAEGMLLAGGTLSRAGDYGASVQGKHDG
jgi:enoyl-CoA hydratase